jgi:hypothetical protein
MTNLVLIVGVCAVLVYILLRLLRRDKEVDMTIGNVAEIGAPVARLPRRSLLDLCLSAEDVEFVESKKSRGLLRMFLRERRRLALAWLRDTRREAKRLYSLHVTAVRHATDLRPAAEVKLLVAVGLFTLVYGAMMASVGFYGPFRTRRFLSSLHIMADVLTDLGGRIAESIAPGRFALDEARGTVQ